MRNIRLFFFVGIVLFFGGQSLYSQSKKEREEQKAKEIKEMIENGRFTIEVDRALPMGGRTVHLTTPYSLEMRGDSAISYLPYFGRAYSLPYGGGTDTQEGVDPWKHYSTVHPLPHRHGTDAPELLPFSGQTLLSGRCILSGRVQHPRSRNRNEKGGSPSDAAAGSETGIRHIRQHTVALLSGLHFRRPQT